MGVAGAIFSSAGRTSTHWIPGSYSRSNFISNEGGGVSSGNIAILGFAELGEPQKLLVFGSSNDARNELLSGEGLDGVLHAFQPGGGLTPQEVGFMRVNPGTQSSRFLKLSAVNVFEIKSFSWGVPMNQVKAKLSAGTVVGSHKLEVEYKGNLVPEDNIEQLSFSIQYVGGTGTAGVMTIDEATLSTTITGDGASDLILNLADYATIGELVDYINNFAAYDAVVLSDNLLDKSINLDFVTAGDIFTAPLVTKSDYEAIYQALRNNQLLNKDDVAKSGVIRTVPDVDAEFVFLTGGTSGAYGTQEFSDALEELKKNNVQLIATPSTEAAIHTLFRNHCNETNSVEGRKERQFYVGGALNESVADVVARSKILNSEFGSLCTPGFKQFDVTGATSEIILYSSAYYACMQVGQVSAQALNNPTTHKAPNIISWEKDYKNPELNDLIRGGVLAGGKDTDDQYITVRSVTTFQGQLLQKNEASVQRETLYQDADLRRRTEKALIGTPLLGDAQLALTFSIFTRAIQDWSALGIIVAQNGALYSGYTASFSGDQLVIEYTTANTIPNNFVFTTHNVTVPVG